MSTRRYFRLHGEFGVRIACLYPKPFDLSVGARQRWETLCSQKPDSRLHFASDPVAYIETTKWFSHCGIPVPEVFGVSGEFGLMLLQDIGDCSLEVALQGKNHHERIAVYNSVLHYAELLQRSTKEACERDMLACKLKLDSEKLLDELEFLLRGVFLLGRKCQTSRIVATLREEWEGLCEEAAGGPMVLCHRDFHSRNLFLNDNTVYVIDHQDMRLGNRYYDLVSLLWDPYAEMTPELRRSFLGDGNLLGWGTIAAVATQRLLKALGTYLIMMLRYQRSEFLRAAQVALRYLSEVVQACQGLPMSATSELIKSVEKALPVDKNTSDI